MIRKHRLGSRLIAATAAASILIAAGCGSDDDSSSSDTTAESTDGTAASDSSDSSNGDVVQVADGSGVEVALVPGGAHPYFQGWIGGGERAAEDFSLGGTTFNETGEWDQATQNGVLDTLAAQGFNAFGIFGVSPTDINTTFTDLQDKGFVVASLASCPAGDVNEASFCLSTDVEVAANNAAVAAIEAMGGEGNLVHLTGNNVDSNTQRRIAGVDAAVAATDGAVTLIQTITDIDVDLGTAEKAVADLLAARGDEINGIVTTAFNPAVAAAEGVKESGLDIVIVAIDDDPSILAGIRAGEVSATVTQNPDAQAYVGSWALALLQTGQCTMAEPGVIVDSGSFVVTADNVDTYNEDRLAKGEQLLVDFSSTYLSC